MLRSTISTVPKSATMKRMAGMMDKFASSVIKEEEPSEAEQNPDTTVGHVSEANKLRGQHHRTEAMHQGTPLDRQSGGIARDGDQSTQIARGIEQRSINMGSFWPSPGESTNTGGSHSHDNFIPSGSGGLHAHPQQLGYQQHPSQTNTSGNGRLLDFGQQHQMSHMHYERHQGHASAGGGGGGGGSSFQHMQQNFDHHPHNFSGASLSLEPFSNNAPGMQSEGTFFSGLRGQQMQQKIRSGMIRWGDW
ncbi:hypothetical protein RBB50_005683 [Rhinocladiella similis]